MEGIAHAPGMGTRGSSKLARSIGNDSDVLDPFRALLEHEPLEVESVSATAKRRDAGFSSAPKRSNETS